MQVQVNVIFDLETELERSALTNRIARMLEAVGVSAAVVPLPGNGTVGGLDAVHQLQTLPPDEAKAKDQAAANLKARQQAAANARAAKQAKATPVSEQPVGVTGGVNGGPIDASGDDPDDTDDALGLNSPSMSPGEAKDAALALVREAYSAGHVAQVKALQKELGVAKFYDVDVTNGHAFYQRVMKLAHEVGIRR